jgi:hypothetical protein
VIGNDIVDLKKARVESNIFRARYLNKVCSQPEIEWIYESRDLFTAFWKIWTMKECAYKAIQRDFKTPMLFNPFAYECNHENSFFGIVKFKEIVLFTRTFETSDYIYSEITSSQKTQRFFGTLEGFLNQLKKEYSLSSEPKFHKTKEGAPLITFPSKTIEVSKTHHGSFQVFQY